MNGNQTHDLFILTIVQHSLHGTGSFFAQATCVFGPVCAPGSTANTLVRLGQDRYKSRLLKSKNCPMKSRLRKDKEVGLYQFICALLSSRTPTILDRQSLADFPFTLCTRREKILGKSRNRTQDFLLCNHQTMTPWIAAHDYELSLAFCEKFRFGLRNAQAKLSLNFELGSTFESLARLYPSNHFDVILMRLITFHFTLCL